MAKVIQQVNDLLTEYEFYLWVMLSGLLSILYKILKADITNPKRILMELVSCVFICLFIIPMLADYFNLSTGTSCLTAWFACKSGELFINKFQPLSKL